LRLAVAAPHAPAALASPRPSPSLTHTHAPIPTQVVAPGDAVAVLPTTGAVRVGPGLVPDPWAAAGPPSSSSSSPPPSSASSAWLVTTRPGVLRRTRAGKLWVEARARRYGPAPTPGDPVVGVVLDKHGEGCSLDVGSPHPAHLPALAFEGATRRNRPDLKPGDLVYARVVSPGRPGEEGEVACTDPAGRAAGFGPLRGGTLVRTTTAHCRRLLAEGGDAVLAALARAGLAFEAAVGLNGRVWVGGPDPAAAAAAAAALSRGEFVSTKADAEALVAGVVAAVGGGGGGGGQ
jgi:exosome complex component RRP40